MGHTPRVPREPGLRICPMSREVSAQHLGRQPSGAHSQESAQCLGRWPSGSRPGLCPQQDAEQPGPQEPEVDTREPADQAAEGSCTIWAGGRDPQSWGGQKRGRRRSGQPVDRGGTRTLRAQVPSPCTGAPPALDTAEGFSAWPGEAVPKLHPVYPSASSWP